MIYDVKEHGKHCKFHFTSRALPSEETSSTQSDLKGTQW